MKSQLKKRAYDEAGLSPPEEKASAKKTTVTQKQNQSLSFTMNLEQIAHAVFEIFCFKTLL